MIKEQAMFRVECFVDADKLGTVLWMLAGRVRELKQTPVIAKRTRNGVIPRTAGKAVDLFIERLFKERLSFIDADYTRAFCQSIGRAESSYTAILAEARDRGIIKNIGKSPADSRWQVNLPKRKPAKRPAKKKGAR